MSAFADSQILLFTQDSFVSDWLTNKLGLPSLFNLTYSPQNVQVNLPTLALTTVRRKKFEFPVFETLKTRGTDEQIVPTPERVKVARDRPRSGRLNWVDVYLDILVTVQTTSLAMPIKSITSESLLTKLGGVTSLDDLRTKLGALYAPSVVDAFFEQLRITSVDQFTSEPGLFLQFIYDAPPAPDPNNVPTLSFPLIVCVQFQTEFSVCESLQAAKLCRSIFENEEDFLTDVDGATVITPYAFVVVFPSAAVTDETIPGLTAAQVFSSVQTLFEAEHVLAFFA